MFGVISVNMLSMKRAFFVCCLICLAFSLNAASFSSLPVQIKANEISYDKEKNVYIATGRVVLEQGERHLEADHVQVDMNKKQAVLKGNVLFKIGNDWIRAKEATIDLKTYQGVLYHAQAFFAENHFYVRGEEVQKTGRDTYLIKGAEITSCDGVSPAWHFSASQVKIKLQSWARARNIVFWVKKMPLLYTPFLALPINQKRQSGFLFPSFTYSERDGTDITLPFFWAIKSNMDATFYQRYLSRRGWMQGLEFRYALNPNDIGIFYFDFLDDHYNNPNYPEMMALKRRWWLRGKMNQLLPANIQLQLDLDVVSDQYYLKEFTEGFDNYQHCHEEFLRYLKRGLSTAEDSLLRESSLSLTKNWDNYSLIAELKYTENLDRTQDETTLQRLPEITFRRNDAPFFHSPFFLKWQGIYTNFWRQEGVKGHRFHFAPTFSLPYQSKYIEVMPQITPMETIYLTDAGNYSRFVYETSLNLKTNLWRRFIWPFSFIHHIEPSITYTYRPKVDQSEIPQFDELDNLEKTNLITYGITNYFLVERKGELKELLHFEVSQSYDIDEARRILAPGEKRRPFSNVRLELQLYPLYGISLDAEAQLSPYGEGIRNSELSINLENRRGDYLNVNYQYSPGEIKDLSMDTFLKLLYNWSLTYHLKHSFQYHQNIETKVGLRYQAQCWGVEFAYSDLYNDRKYMIIFKLSGIGEFKGITF